uniref:Uncharacterized protein n=1 Tax=Arundo donax TaxID=35708 RepID=A0A0A9GAV5_ARUDO
MPAPVQYQLATMPVDDKATRFIVDKK